MYRLMKKWAPCSSSVGTIGGLIRTKDVVDVLLLEEEEDELDRLGCVSCSASGLARRLAGVIGEYDEVEFDGDAETASSGPSPTPHCA